MWSRIRGFSFDGLGWVGFIGIGGYCCNYRENNDSISFVQIFFSVMVIIFVNSRRVDKIIQKCLPGSSLTGVVPLLNFRPFSEFCGQGVGHFDK
jgi:hypothetical protein